MVAPVCNITCGDSPTGGGGGGLGASVAGSMSVGFGFTQQLLAPTPLTIGFAPGDTFRNTEFLAPSILLYTGAVPAVVGISANLTGALSDESVSEIVTVRFDILVNGEICGSGVFAVMKDTVSGVDVGHVHQVTALCVTELQPGDIISLQTFPLSPQDANVMVIYASSLVIEG